ncbi:MAG: hypothetical protein ACRDTC_10305 [Pseudonocardiaceae bacterium]
MRTGEGWAYIASVIDGYSPMVVGWAIADHRRTGLVVDALVMALEQRRPARGVKGTTTRKASLFVGLSDTERIRRRVRNATAPRRIAGVNGSGNAPASRMLS